MFFGCFVDNLTRSVCIYLTASHPDSSFNTVLSGVILPSQLVHSLDLLAQIARILKPSGKLTLAEPTGKSIVHVTFNLIKVREHTQFSYGV